MTAASQQAASRAIHHEILGFETAFFNNIASIGLRVPMFQQSGDGSFGRDDFGDLTAIFSALGLYNATTPLSNTTIETPAQTAGYSASWTVPFAARAYFEKMACRGTDEELVRVLVNDRVVPLQNCDADELERCRLSKFIDSLSFAREGGHWDKCFA